jgi:group I intron endonuclease
MMAAIRKYGWRNIRHEILMTGLTKEQAENVEIMLIKALHLTERKCGYNIANGGASCTSGKTRSPEIRQKISIRKMGHSVSAETREKISQSKKGTPAPNKGVPLSPEQKEKALQTAFKKGSQPWNVGKTYSAEYRERLRQAHLGKPNLVNRKSVQCVETGVVYESLAEAEKWIVGNRQNIRLSCNNPEKTSGGYHWRWA